MYWAGNPFRGALSELALEFGGFQAKKENEMEYIIGIAPLGVQADIGDVIHRADTLGTCVMRYRIEEIL